MRVWTGRENSDGGIENNTPLSLATLPPDQALAFAACLFLSAAGCENSLLALPRDGTEHSIPGLRYRVKWQKWNEHGPALWIFKKNARRIFWLDS